MLYCGKKIVEGCSFPFGKYLYRIVRAIPYPTRYTELPCGLYRPIAEADTLNSALYKGAGCFPFGSVRRILCIPDASSAFIVCHTLMPYLTNAQNRALQLNRLF